jgi:hypothetical protein
VCLEVKGTGTRVERIRVQRTSRTPICGSRARATIGARSLISPLRAACVRGVASVDFTTHLTVADGTKVCGSWFESGRWLPATPCVTLHR